MRRITYQLIPSNRYEGNYLMKLLLITATFTPVILYAILPSVAITYDATILFALISLLSLAIVAGIATLTKGSN